MGVVICAYDDEGSGPSVLLLHSGVCDRRMWAAQAVHLSHSYRVVRPDLRGFGQTPLPPEQFSYAGDVVDLLDHLDIERAVFVGSSFGGRVALEVAATHPERVSALLLLCPAYRDMEPTPAAADFGAEEDRLLGLGDIDGAVELNVTAWLGPEATDDCREAVREMQRRAFEVQLAADEAEPGPQLTPVDVDLGAIAVPTLVVTGRRDMDHFQSIARHLADGIVGAQLETLEWAAHLPSLERPDEVNALIADFLASVPAWSEPGQTPCTRST